MKQKEDIHELIAKKLSGEIDKQELVFLNNWLNTDVKNKELYHKFKEIWERSSDFGNDFAPDISKAINRYKKRIEKAILLKKKRTKIIRLTQFAAAAVILLFFVYLTNSYLKTNDLITVVSDSTVTKQIILPDSSIIYLNKNTIVKYNKSFKKRIVKLEGEAFFEVRKLNGARFTVNTKSTSVTVLGTSFNIKAPTDEINTQVSVLTGKVEFVPKGINKKLIIKTGQQATFNKPLSKTELSAIKNHNFLVWKTGVLSFKGNSLKEVLATLTENYKIEFNVSDEKMFDLRLTCEFNDQTIEEILEEIEIILPIKINIQGKKAIIEPIE